MVGPVVVWETYIYSPCADTDSTLPICILWDWGSFYLFVFPKLFKTPECTDRNYVVGFWLHKSPLGLYGRRYPHGRFRIPMLICTGMVTKSSNCDCIGTILTVVSRIKTMFESFECARWNYRPFDCKRRGARIFLVVLWLKCKKARQIHFRSWHYHIMDTTRDIVGHHPLTLRACHIIIIFANLWRISTIIFPFDQW